jgi:hypothetical protein
MVVLGGIQLQACVSTGRSSMDNCEIVAKLPEIFSNATTALPTAYCHVDPEDFEPDAGTLIFGGVISGC